MNDRGVQMLGAILLLLALLTFALLGYLWWRALAEHDAAPDQPLAPTPFARATVVGPIPTATPVPPERLPMPATPTRTRVPMLVLPETEPTATPVPALWILDTPTPTRRPVQRG